MNIFLTQVAQTIASYIVTMGGIDVLTFTAGVGEKGFEDREEICKKLAFLGLKLDIEKNKSKNIEDRISLEDSKIDVWVVPTNEELMIARDTEKIVNESKII